MSQYFVIYSQKLAGELMVKGFVLKKMQKDEKHSKRNVFLFRDSPELREFIQNR